MRNDQNAQRSTQEDQGTESPNRKGEDGGARTEAICPLSDQLDDLALTTWPPASFPSRSVEILDLFPRKVKMI